MKVSSRQAYGAAWKDLKGMPKVWVTLALLLVGPVWVSLVLGIIGINGVGSLISFITALIATRIALQIVDGKPAVGAGIVPPIMTYLKLLGAVVIASVPVMLAGLLAGLMPLIAVPLFLIAALAAVVIIVVMTIYHYYIVDTNGGIIDCFEQAISLAQRQPWPLVVFVAASFALNIAGLLVFTLGLVVTLPWTVVAGARVYRALQADGVSVPAKAAVQ